jgi:hypothetical protein
MFNPETISALLAANSAKDFFVICLEKQAKTQKTSVNFAEFARRAGFSARSFPRDVALGRRKITRNTVPQFVRGLGLYGEWADLFALMVDRDLLEKSKNLSLEKSIHHRLKHLQQQLTLKKPERFKGQIPMLSYWAEVYAALGSVESGATLDDVAMRTHLPVSRIKTILDKMIGQSMARHDQQRYFPISFHLAFLGKDQRDSAQQYYLDSLKSLQIRAKERFRDSSQTLYRSIVVSVDRERIPELRNRLDELLNEFTAYAESPEGNRISRFVVGFD